MAAKHHSTRGDKATDHHQGLRPEARFFKYFLISAISFVSSLSAIVYANLVMPPSGIQEMVALIGLIVAFPSGASSAFFYLRILFARLIRFKNRE